MTEVVALVGLVLAAAAFVVSLRALKWAREAARAGRDSADAAAESLRWSKISAEAAQSSASVSATAEAARQDEAAEAAVGWSVTRGHPGQVIVRNDGPAAARQVGVRLSPSSAAGNPVQLDNVDEMLPGAVRVIDVRGHDEQPNPWIEMCWKLDPSDLQWRRRKLLMPQKPRPARVGRANFR